LLEIDTIIWLIALAITVTVPVTACPLPEVPPITIDGLIDRMPEAAGITVRVAHLTPPSIEHVPVTVTEVEADTPPVVATNVADICPAAIGTEPGTLTEPLLLTRLITTPPAGAGFVSVIVPTEF